MQICLFKPWTFQTLELRAVSQVTLLVKVFHCSLSVLPLPAKLFHVLQDAKPSLLLLFQVCCCHLQALTEHSVNYHQRLPLLQRG